MHLVIYSLSVNRAIGKCYTQSWTLEYTVILEYAADESVFVVSYEKSRATANSKQQRWFDLWSNHLLINDCWMFGQPANYLQLF